MNQTSQPAQSSFSPLQDMRTASSWLRFLIEAWSISVEVFLRRGFGCHYLDLRAAAAIVLLFTYPVFWMRDDPRPMLVMLGLYLVMLLRARFDGIRRRFRGDLEHSRYSGRPSLMKRFAKLKETTIKSRVEPLVVTAAGLAALPFWPPLAVYLFIAAFAMVASTGIQLMYERAKARQALDAMIEARLHGERVRGMSGKGVV